MNVSSTRRQFLNRTTVIAGVAAAAWKSVSVLRAADSPGEKVVVGVMSCSGRGMSHMKALLQVPNVEIAYVCDVDSTRLTTGVREVMKKQAKEPKAVKDFRRILDDPDVHAITIATPNHWHAIAAIIACAAGKHVYVEKPGSHNAREGELMVAAARKHKRIVQMGNQRRSWPGMIEAVEKLRDGIIGRVFSARCWYVASRPTIGRGKPASPPESLDWTLWQGAAPERPYLDNIVHYNWHWRWHWGGGEMANNGIHSLDVARWGLGVEYPRRITYGGGRYHFDDDQETPDTGVATFDFGNVFISWDCSSCHPRKGESLSTTNFYGEKGTLIVDGGGYKVFDPAGKQVAEGKGRGGDVEHFANFADAVRGKVKPNSEIAEGQKSTLLCHLANLAWRVGHTINFDPRTRQIVGDDAAMRFWGREYREGWEPKV